MRYAIYTIRFADGRTQAGRDFLPPIGLWVPAGADADGPRYGAHLSEEEWAELRVAWSLARPEPSLGAVAPNGQHLAGSIHLFDPMDWNVGRVTPVRDAALFVSNPLVAAVA